MLQERIQGMRNEVQVQAERRNVLIVKEMFVLDNSLRESTVGQLRGHTIENKWKIYEEVGITIFYRRSWFVAFGA